MSTTDRRIDIAIIGMACIFPSAPDLATYWQNVIAKLDAMGDPPEEWEAERFFDPDSKENDRIYCKRGGYLGDLARFNPIEYGTMPVSVDGGEPDHFLALRVAHEALADAGYREDRVDPTRTEVILGRGTYINRGYSNLLQHGLIVDQTLRILQELHPDYSDQDLRAIKRKLKESLPPFNAEVAPGLVPNIVSGRIANRLNFMGPNYTVDAACASALIAIDLAVQDLVTGRCDMAIVGGVHVSTPPQILMIFCQLNALSRTSQIRPFDKDADGTLLGEGLGILVLKRREDAERAGDRIYALIKAVGAASDGRALGLLTPRVDGEELAMRRAYDAARISPRTVHLIEAHGTGTAVGDETEIEALKRVFGERNGSVPWCALGSVKSMIGHTIPAAGAAGVIKAAIGLYHKILPPTLHCDTPNPKFELEKTPFYVNTEARPWIHGSLETPRRAGVNAFGFGGINAHIILEEYPGMDESRSPSFLRRWETEMIFLQGDSRNDLLLKVDQLHQYLEAVAEIELKDLAYTLNTLQKRSPARLALVASSRDDLLAKLRYAVERLSDPNCRQIKERSGIYHFSEPLGPDGKVAFLFPGEGSQYVNMLADLCLHFPEVRSRFDFMDRAFTGHRRKYLPSQFIFPPPTPQPAQDREANERKLWEMDIGAEAVFAASQGILALLTRLKIEPDFVVGHSTGEYSALLAAGAFQVESEEELTRYILDLNRIYEELEARGEIPKGTLLAVGAVGGDVIEGLRAASPEPLYVAMENCPSQFVLCGPTQAVRWARDRLGAVGAICTPLPFERPYHTPLFAPVHTSLKAFFDRLPLVSPRVPIYSCATAEPMPPDPEAIRALAWTQWVLPVRFRQTVENLYTAGARIFLEVGPRGVLTGFVDDILRTKPHLALASDSQRRSGVTQLHHVLALLWAHHVPLSPEPLYARRDPHRLSLHVQTDRAAFVAAADKGMRLSLGLQPLRLGSKGDRPVTARVALARRPPGQTAAQPEFAPAPTPLVTLPGEASGAQIQASPAPRAPVGSSLPGSGSPADVLQAYFKTMEEFLGVQQSVLETYLAVGNGTAPVGAVPTASTPARPTVRLASPGGELPRHEASMRVAAARQPAPLLVEEPAPPVAGALAEPDVQRILLDLVAEKTGYPVEMLGLTLNLEADLGIDPIMRVEILTVAVRKLNLLPGRDLERLTALRTLGEIVHALTTLLDTPAEATVPPSSTAPDDLPLFPLLGRVTAFKVGERLEAVRQFDPQEDVFLRDHTLGGPVSTIDTTLTALPIMPLTMSMEILAQAAAALLPGRRLIKLRDIRAYRWISFDQLPVSLRITALRNFQHEDLEVDVHVREMSEASSASAPVIIEGTAVFSDTYPPSPSVSSFPLKGERPSRWQPDHLYTEGMFHGPTFQGVISVDRWGEDGIEATLQVLSLDGLFRSIPNAVWVTDPILLDAAGQLVGYWTAEHLTTGFNVFPFRLQELQIFGPLLPVGEEVLCRARIRLEGDQQVRSDIDLLDREGRLHMRMVSWEDRRFELPEEFYRLRIRPATAFLSREWNTPIRHMTGCVGMACCLCGPFHDEFLNSHHMIWQRVLAHLILGRRERTIWQKLACPNKRRIEWLLGRTAAKDAVRRILKKHHGLELCPADIEILPDERGKPCVVGEWTEMVGGPPSVSITHSAGCAAAWACLRSESCDVGLDMEQLEGRGRDRDGLIEAFTAEEQAMLSCLKTESGEWPLRFWCAKEALAKALGLGFSGRPRDLLVEKVDPASGDAWLSTKGELATSVPGVARTLQAVRTLREGPWIVAAAVMTTNTTTHKGVDDGTSQPADDRRDGHHYQEADQDPGRHDERLGHGVLGRHQR